MDSFSAQQFQKSKTFTHFTKNVIVYVMLGIFCGQESQFTACG
jgi:hypothetical protein